jgi:hypothetical protein
MGYFNMPEMTTAQPLGKPLKKETVSPAWVDEQRTSYTPPKQTPIEAIEELFGVMPLESQKKFDPFVTSGFFYLSKNNPAMVGEKYKDALALHDPTIKEEVVFISAIKQLLGV